MFIPRRLGLSVICLVVLTVLLQTALMLNPGYFSHDELQFGAHANVSHWQSLPWASWTDWSQFQFRPLTFNAWLLLSRMLFDTPRLFHLLFVSIGALNVGLLFVLLLRLNVRANIAGIASLGFALTPYATFVHGWVGCLAELLFLGLVLQTAILLEYGIAEHWPMWRICGVALITTSLALLVKETAVVIPLLIALSWLLVRPARSLAWATLASALPTVLYLGLRLPTLIFKPHAGYGIDVLSAPRHWLQYWLYLPAVLTFEVHNVLGSFEIELGLISLWLASLAMIWRAHRKAAIWLLLGSTIPLAPVLILDSSANQYGYAFSAVVASAFALGWPYLRTLPRASVLLLLALSTLHGFQVQGMMLHIGELQSHFQPALAEVLRTRPGVVRLRLPPAEAWLYQRITHEIPSYRGVPIRGRITLVGLEDSADFQIEADGGISDLKYAAAKPPATVPDARSARVSQARIHADPPLIQVCDGSGLGVVTIAWEAADFKAVEVRVGRPNGSLFASGGSVGSAVTGKWVRDGLTFYLQDPSSAETLAFATVNATHTGC